MTEPLFSVRGLRVSLPDPRCKTLLGRKPLVEILRGRLEGESPITQDSLSSALTEDCVLDFRPAGKKLGLDFGKLTGRQAIVDALIPLLGPLDTSHTAELRSEHIADVARHAGVLRLDSAAAYQRREVVLGHA